MNKNGDSSMSLIGAAVIVIILIVLAYVYIQNIDEGQKEARTFCPDKYCIPKDETCYFPRATQMAVCSDSVGGKDMKCCATISELREGTKADESTNTTTSSKTENSIEIRLGASEQKINTGSSKELALGEMYTYRIWGEGPDASFCTVKMIEPETGTITQDPGMSINIEKASCLQRSGTQQISLKPEEPGKTYRLEIILYDVSEEQISSASINIKTEGTPKTCEYNTCSQVPRSQCVNPVPNCSELNCEWQQNGPDGTCVIAQY